MKRLLANFLLFFITLFISLALAEAALRVIYPTPKKNQVSSMEYRHDWTFNSDGFRDEEFEPRLGTLKKKAVFLGDSFTAGMGVERPDSFANMLSGRFSENYETFNLGRIGTGTLAQEKIFEANLPRIRPEAAVLFFYWNDVQDNLQEAASGGRAQNSPAPRMERGQTRPFFGFLSFAKPLLRKTLLYQWAGANYRILLAKLGIAKLDFQIEFDFFKIRPTPEVEKAWNVTEKALVEFAEASRAADCRLVVVYVPKREQFVGWENVLKFYKADPREYDRFNVNKRLGEICALLGVPYVDVSQELAALPETGKMYYKFDTHFTKTGNRLFAERVMKKLDGIL